MPDIYRQNLSKLRQRFPRVAAEVERVSPETVLIAQTRDGGYCYTVPDGAGGRKPITDPDTPIAPAKRAVLHYEQTLTNTQNPALVIGLYPGFILDMVYNFFADLAEKTRFLRRIYVIVDSAECLVGWLKAMDRSKYLDCPDIEFYIPEQLPEVVRLIETDRSRSHNFMPMSMLPDNRVNDMIEPLAQLFVRRQNEAELMRAANNAYYNAMTDGDLAKIIAGEAGRKPRLLFPTHSSSTVVQYSARDTCETFEEMGWETLIHKSTHGCSVWEMVKTINEFKPDVTIFVNHLRTEGVGPEVYPENMMFITWVQDSPTYILDRKEAEVWNAMALGHGEVSGSQCSVISEGEEQGVGSREPSSSPKTEDAKRVAYQTPNTVTTPERRRDLIIGYVGQLKSFGYHEDRLVEMPMIVNPRIFRPRELTEEQKAKYGCDVMFASRCGAPTEERVDELFEDFNDARGIACSRRLLQRIHDHLWAGYRAEKTFTSEDMLKDELFRVPGFGDWFTALNTDDQGYAILRLFWRLNDIIYRQVVVEWLVDYAESKKQGENGAEPFRLHLYGNDWERNSLFCGHARGVIEHGLELAVAYAAARLSLHLNITEGTHQRLGEIIASGGTPITRVASKNSLIAPALASAFRAVAGAERGAGTVELSTDEEMEFNGFLFETAARHLAENPRLSQDELEMKVQESLSNRLATQYDWILPHWSEQCFTDRSELVSILESIH